MRFSFTRRTLTSMHFTGLLGHVARPHGAVILCLADGSELIRYPERAREYAVLLEFLFAASQPGRLLPVELCVYRNMEINSFTIIDLKMRIRLHVHPERNRKAYQALWTVLEVGARLYR